MARTAALSLLFAFLVVTPGSIPEARAASKPAVPQSAPDVSLPSRNGGRVSLLTFRGKVVLVDFWASWCGPCKQSFPWLASLRSRYPDSTLAVVAINLDKKREAAEDFLIDHPASFTVLFDPDGKSADAFLSASHASPGIPMSFIIGRDGTILDARIGFDPKKTAAYEATIAEALAR